MCVLEIAGHSPAGSWRSHLPERCSGFALKREPVLTPPGAPSTQRVNSHSLLAPFSFSDTFPTNWSGRNEARVSQRARAEWDCAVSTFSIVGFFGQSQDQWPLSYFRDK